MLCMQANESISKRALENVLVENFTQILKNVKHEKSIAAQIEIVKHYFTTAWEMLNDSHNKTGSQALTNLEAKKIAYTMLQLHLHAIKNGLILQFSSIF